MSSTTKVTCEKLLRDAERSARCAVPTNEGERSRFSYLERTGELISPYPGIYARANTWNALYPSQRIRRIMRTIARIHPDWVFVGASAAVAHAVAIPPKGNVAAQDREDWHWNLRVKRTRQADSRLTMRSGLG